MDTPRRYHPIHVTLHWLIAIGVFINLYLGIIVFEQRGGNPADFQARNTLQVIHMAIGITILLLLLIRFIMRMTVKRPAEATAGNNFLDMLARVVHYGLYLTVLVVTVIGLTFSLQTGRFQSAFLGVESQFGPPPGGFSQIEGTSGALPQNQFSGGSANSGFQGGPPPGGGFSLLRIHEWTAYLLLALISLHILAALYHQFIRRDNLIARMWYGTR